MDLRLYLLQRATAVLMVPLVIGHIIVIFYATSDGLSASEILSRTRGSWGWALFYSSFVIAVAIHGAIGLRAIAFEWFALRGTGSLVLMWTTGLLLLVLGLRGVVAVTFPGLLAGALT